MNIALAGFVIIILLLPGLLFRKSYLSGEFSREYIVEDFFELLVNSLIPSFIFYIVIGFPISYFAGYPYDFQRALGLLSSDKDLLSRSLENIEVYKYQIVSFHLFINVLAYILGFRAKNIVLKYNCDTKYTNLRFDNVWHYILTAKFILFNRSQINLTYDSIDDIDITYVYALVNVGNTPIVYSGVLVDYELSKDGSLDLLYLKNVKKKLLSLNNNEQPINNDFRDIDGSVLILKYQNIVNLSVSFITMDIGTDDNGKTTVNPRLIS